MSFLSDLFNPPAKKTNPEAQYRFDNDVFTTLQALTYVSNISVINNPNFATLGINGLTPITQADGDGAEFSSGWNVFGSASATYTITPTAYPTGAITGTSPSTNPTSSPYYIHVAVASHNGGSFYFYQQQADTVRKYQNDFLTYGVIIRNNENKVIKVRMELFSFYDPSSALIADNTIYLQPGLNRVTSQVQTDKLSGKTISGSNYTQFRISFQDLVNGTADIDIYQIKCEFGTISTRLE